MFPWIKNGLLMMRCRGTSTIYLGNALSRESMRMKYDFKRVSSSQEEHLCKEETSLKYWLRQAI